MVRSLHLRELVDDEGRVDGPALAAPGEARARDGSECRSQPRAVLALAAGRRGGSTHRVRQRDPGPRTAAAQTHNGLSQNSLSQNGYGITITITIVINIIISIIIIITTTIIIIL